MFWIAYVLARLLGASFADAMGKPTIVGGLGWGAGSVALVLTGLIVVGVWAQASTDTRQGRSLRL